MSQHVVFMPHKRVIVRRFSHVNHARRTRSLLARFSQARRVMRHAAQPAAGLRAEARLLTMAGIILLLIGFPLTLWLALQALAPDGLSPVLPAAAGGPPLLLGYLACHFASRRMLRARELERGAR